MTTARVLPLRVVSPNFSSSFPFPLITSHLRRHHHHHHHSTARANTNHHHHHHPAHPSPSPSSPQHLFHTTSSSRAMESNTNNSDWKNRAPYRTTDPDPDPKKQYTARCHCGRVRYWLSRDRPLAAKFCHCVDCQALHGAPFQWAAIFDKADLHFEPGAVDGLAFYHARTREPGYHLPVKVSCATCHAPIMDEGRRMVLMFPAIIEFGDAEHKKFFDPQCHIFYSQRVVDLPDGKPKWTGLDGTSELMKDVDAHQMESVVGKREVETVDQ
ncbi:Mss4-like protein [Biscogniauxia sp. FL1348]|nr:Mss4-like protein [Biscogniauxia sp. FL1348]